MKDEIIDLYLTPEIFVDGFTQHTSHNGVMTCVGYRKFSGGNVVVVRLTWPTANTQSAINDAHGAINNEWGRAPGDKVH